MSLSAPQPVIPDVTRVTHHAIYRVIDRLESNYPVDTWKYRDIAVWPLLRGMIRPRLFSVYSPALPSQRDSVAVDARPSLIRRSASVTDFIVTRFAESLKCRAATRADSNTIARLGGRRAAIFLSGPLTGVEANGRWFDRYLEPIAQAYDRRGETTLSIQSSTVYRSPRFRPTFFMGPVQERLVATRILRRWPSFGPAPEGYQEALALLRSEGIPTDGFQWEEILRQAVHIDDLARWFERLLAATGAEVVYLVQYANVVCSAACLACWRRGHLAIDVQHGVQGGVNDTYNRWSVVPNEGYGLLPGAFWVWNDRDRAEINAWSERVAPMHAAFVGGNVSMALDSTIDRTTANEWTRRIAEARAPGTRFDILVTLNHEAIYRDDWQRLAQLIARGPTEWMWWIRKHPASRYHLDGLRLTSIEHNIETIAGLRLPNVNHDVASDLPLAALLPRVHVHVTGASSVAIEAAEFGIPTLFVNSLARSHFEDLIASGMAEYENDMVQVEDWLCRHAAGGKRQSAVIDQQSIPSAIDKIRQQAALFKAARQARPS